MKKYFAILLIFAIMIAFLPSSVSAITLGEYEAKLTKFKSDEQANQQAINKTDSEIRTTNNNISSIKNEILSLTQEISRLNDEISKYDREINDKILQSKNILEYLQLSDEGNLFFEYIFNSENVTDLIYRSTVVQEITEYNNKTINSLKDMIDGNKKRQEEIDDRQITLNNKEEQLNDNLATLGEKRSSLGENAVTVAQQIKIYQELVDSYKKLGCKSGDVIGVDCAVQGDSGVFRRPTQTGYITDTFGMRDGKLHRAVDIGSSNGKGEKIYPVANGTVTAKYYDLYGALTVVIEHYSAVKGQWYSSLYAHLSSYAPNLYVGKSVTSDQYIGYMGNTGYSFGVHLHMEVTPCRLYNLNDKNCNTWNNYVAFVQKQYNNGYKGPASLITFPSKGWTTR